MSAHCGGRLGKNKGQNQRKHPKPSNHQNQDFNTTITNNNSINGNPQNTAPKIQLSIENINNISNISQIIAKSMGIHFFFFFLNIFHIFGNTIQKMIKHRNQLTQKKHKHKT